MIQIDTEIIIQFIKIVGIIFAAFHFLSGFVLMSKINRMSRILHTRTASFLSVLNVAYLLFLGAIVVLMFLL